MPEYDFSGKVAFVTGAARGQGRSHAEHYARNGADVVVTDICHNIETNQYPLGRREELEETADSVEDLGQEAHTVEMDIRDEDEVRAAVDEAIEEMGHIDILANNAGIWHVSSMTELDEAAWDEMLDTNLKGTWLCSKHVGKHFIEKGEGGKIVSTGSVASINGQVNSGHYAASKHGVAGLTKTLALELADYDVNVNAVCPTGVDTPMVNGMVEAVGEEALGALEEVTGPFNLFDPEDPNIEPEHISEAYMWLSSDAAEYVTGVVLPVDAGMTIK